MVQLRHFALLSALVFCLAPCFAAGQTGLTVEVTNGTTKTTAPVDIETIVQIYVQDQLLQTFTGRTDADGKAVFENVPEGKDMTAVARAKYHDMMFSGKSVTLNPEQGEHVTSVEVFDVSTDKSQLSVETHHMILKAAPGSLEITEYMEIKNPSNFAITSSTRDDQNRAIVLEVKLPHGFRNLKPLSYFEDQAIVVTDDGFYDTMAVPPGEQNANFSYILDVTSETMDVVKTISLPTSEFVLFAELGQAKIHGFGKTAQQATSSSGEPMQYFSRKGLSPGDEVTFRLTKLNTGSSGPTKWIIAAIAISAAIVLIALRLTPREKSNP